MTFRKTFAKLRDPEYRKAFVSSQINIGIPFQIRALLKSRGWTQEKLAERTGMLQPRISALLTPGKVRPNIETLRRLAEAFDCGLEVRFVPFGNLVQWSEHFDPEHFNIPTFDEEIRQAEEREDALVAASRIPLTNTFVTIDDQEMWQVGSFTQLAIGTSVNTAPKATEVQLDAGAVFDRWLREPAASAEYNQLGDRYMRAIEQAKEQEIQRAA